MSWRYLSGDTKGRSVCVVHLVDGAAMQVGKLSLRDIPWNVRVNLIPVQETMNPVKVKVFDDEAHDALEDDRAPESDVSVRRQQRRTRPGEGGHSECRESSALDA